MPSVAERIPTSRGIALERARGQPRLTGLETIYGGLLWQQPTQNHRLWWKQSFWAGREP
jgi:hypothetical protein